MRAITLLIFFLTIAAHADEYASASSTISGFASLDSRPYSIAFYYEAESQAASVMFDFGRAQLSLGIINVLQIPEHEPPGGVFIDRHTPLAEELNGIEVDVGDDTAFLLAISFDW